MFFVGSFFVLLSYAISAKFILSRKVLLESLCFFITGIYVSLFVLFELINQITNTSLLNKNALFKGLILIALFNFLYLIAAKVFKNKCNCRAFLATKQSIKIQSKVLFLAVFLLLLKILSIILSGVGSIRDYVDSFGQTENIPHSFSFLSICLNFSMYYLSLFNILLKNRVQYFITIFCGLLISYLLSTSRSGVFVYVIPFVINSYYFDKTRLISVLNIKNVILSIILLIISTGLKANIKYLGLDSIRDLTFNALVGNFVAALSSRLGSDSVINGYIYLVERISENKALLMHGNVLETTFTIWVPRFIYSLFGEEKPKHIFTGLGYLVHPNQFENPLATDAPTIYGYSYLDFDIFSLIPISFFVGLSLSFLSYLFIKNKKYLSIYIWYTFLTSSFCFPFVESGFISFVYFIVNSLIILLLSIFFFGKEKIQYNIT